MEINGKLAQPSADGGSSLSWKESIAKLMEDGKDEKKFDFNVPVGEFDKQQLQVKIRYVNGKGWRINEEVNTFH